jgi:hypothetical protein
MLTFGAAVLGLLIASPEIRMVRIGQFGIGDHWAVVGSSAVIVSVQMLTLGIAALLVGYRDGYRLASDAVARVLRHSTLGSWLLAALATTGIGFVWAATIAGGWFESNFGAMNQMRALIGAATLVIIGVQIGFGGFLLSVVAGNRLRHDSVLGANASGSAVGGQDMVPDQAQPDYRA